MLSVKICLVYKSKAFHALEDFKKETAWGCLFAVVIVLHLWLSENGLPKFENNWNHFQMFQENKTNIWRIPTLKEKELLVSLQCDVILNIFLNTFFHDCRRNIFPNLSVVLLILLRYKNTCGCKVKNFAMTSHDHKFNFHLIRKLIRWF